MLVLTRKIGERIRIDEEIRIEILWADSERVKVGIVAPKEVRIVREELIEPTGEEEGV